LTKKILTASLTVALVAALIGGGTMAWLTAKAEAPQNTFTAGNVTIEAGQTAIRHLGFTPGQPVVGPVVIGNYAFIPNAEEASVSKVDLAADPPAEVARYSTVQPRTTDPYLYPVYRVSRLAMDSYGNAWVLNSMTGQNDPTTRQGSVVRISGSPVAGEIPGTTTSNSGGLGGMIDNDVRVSIFDVGNPGDCPRTISIVEEGGNLYLWIGFYMAEYFEKFAYDPVANTLTSTGDSIYVAPYNGYTAVIDGNGILWGVSRNASPYPSPSGTPGVFYFDTNDLGAGVTALLYDLPGKSGENPYAIVLKSDGTVWVSDGSNWGTNQARYFAVYTWGTPVTVEYVNTGVNSQAMRGFMEDGDGNIWATSIDGQVIKLTWTGAAWSGATMLSGLGELTGLGADAFGWFWVIRYSTDQMTRFDPTLADPIPQDVSVPLGDGPYAYGNFVQLRPPDRPWNPGDCSEVEFWVHNTGSKNIRIQVSAFNSSWEFNWGWLWENWDALCFNEKYGERPPTMDGEAWDDFVAAVLALEDPVVVTLCDKYADDWEEVNGYFYYVGPEDPIEPCTTVQICLRVCLDGEKATNEFQGGTYTLRVRFEAVQSSNDAPMGVWGVDLW
jgi:predicted ribosomally synthesized peptide with SipW-like signal peptide